MYAIHILFLLTLGAQELNAADIRIDARQGESWRGAVGAVPALVLRGDYKERAQAHGYLVAAEILAVIDDYVIPAAGGPGPYERVLRPLVGLMSWDQRSAVELAAMHAGMVAALGAEALQLAALGRALGVDDLRIANALPDWSGFACSSLSVWGKASADGRTRHARNLDYPHSPALLAAQFLILQIPNAETEADEVPSLGLSFAGSIGVYTALSAQGIFVAIHDVPVSGRPQPQGAHPRSLTLARALQGAQHPVDMLRFLDGKPVVMGNNILIGDAHAAVIAEWGPATGAQALAWAPGPERFYLACTNHHQGLAGPVAPDSRRRLGHLEAAAAAPLGGEQLQQALRRVANRSTIHSVIVDPAARELSVALMTRPGRSAAAGPWTTISWAKLEAAR
ncbi:MAG: hypothetical protein EA402_13225 [Planctomycetota bacterium]|nr:MAG: hypothetical protein EA402_13225 [Planctomycetota bacterium]